MANIFKQSLDVTQHPNRNNHDLSHKVHGSYKMGVLYPFLCHPVVPNDSFRIDTACAFQLMPMPFPTQTNIRCIFHYFYVRNKNIWENWENWLQGLEEHTPPFIDQPNTFYKTGSLADHLGIPTTIVRNNEIMSYFKPARFSLTGETATSKLAISNSLTLEDVGMLYPEATLYTDGSSQITSHSVLYGRTDYFFNPNYLKGFMFSVLIPVELLGLTSSSTREQIASKLSRNFRLTLLYGNGSGLESYGIARYFNVVANPWSIPTSYELTQVQESGETYYYVNITCTAPDISESPAWLDLFKFSNDISVCFGFELSTSVDPDVYPYLPSFSTDSNAVIINSPTGIFDVSSSDAVCPYYSSSNDGNDTIKISALPFRAYESIIRCYYKNSVLQPLKIDGVEKYNRYNTNLGDGADTTNYVLEQRNWELDAYTSCLPSPQQGNTPLVGITDSGRGVIEDPETGERLRFSATRDSENGTESIEVEGGEGLENMRTLVNLSRSNTSGITIPDIRNVNALQRFLEQSIRSGYKYIDFIKGHFGSEPKYAELDMPEFLGGFTQRVDVNMISNSNGVVPTDAEDIALGSFAGQARAFGGAKHGITRYFDDYGWLVGIMCIVPDNTYSQLLPKWFTYTDRLSYFFPEFAQTNLQPITYSEVCPIQSHLEYTGGETGHLLTDTFGYQRPNHELVWCPDSLHGEFRKTLNNYVINRVFQSRPELGDQFLKIDPEDTNRIFSYTEADNDVVVGQIAIKMTAKRPVPRIVIPSLGK